jgi:hypothetical protein
VESIQELLNRGAEQLVGRASGPMHVRLLIQPLMSTILAYRAGVRDAKQGRAPFLWSVLTQSAERRNLVRSGWQDVNRLFILAIVLDVTYQGIVLHTLYPVQAVLVAFTVAVVPYVLFRGVVTRLARGFYRPPRGGTPGEASK